jgi:adenylate cyclase
MRSWRRWRKPRPQPRRRERSDRLLRNILPSSVADELTAQGRIQPRYHESATILFADFKDFTRLTEALDPASLVEQLNHNFARFDEIVASARLEPLKTVGDAYLCAGGLPEPNRTHAIDACLAALQMQKFIGDANRQRQQLRLAPWQLRIGVKTGSVIAGVVGTRRFTYDVWGNTVNLAQRLEETCEPGRINIAGSTLHHVQGLFETEPRGKVAVKHMDALEMYFLDRIKPDLAADAAGCLPNERFWQASGLG